MNKRRSVNIAKLREIGWSLWDPIGLLDTKDSSVADFPEDEYDSYLLIAFSKLKNGASADLVADYLYNISNEYMGLGESSQLRAKAELTAQEIYESLEFLT